MSIDPVSGVIPTLATRGDVEVRAYHLEQRRSRSSLCFRRYMTDYLAQGFILQTLLLLHVLFSHVG